MAAATGLSEKSVRRIWYKHNDNPKPFIWTAQASDILEKVKRARKVLDNL